MKHTDEPFTNWDGRTRPQGAHNLAIVVADAQLSGDGLCCENQGHHSGDRTEGAEGHRLGLDREFHRGDDA